LHFLPVEDWRLSVPQPEKLREIRETFTEKQKFLSILKNSIAITLADITASKDPSTVPG
jgi:hypothetical protein